MRTWLLVLMIALLPVRSWVGDAMAGEMLAQHLGAATASTAAAVAAPQATTPHDCMGHGAHDPGAAAHAPVAQADSAATAVPGDCPTCATCQSCSAVGLVFAGPTLADDDFPSAVPTTAAPQFASAETARVHKPPIS